VDGVYDANYEYVQSFSIVIHFDDPIPLSLVRFFTTDHSRGYEFFVDMTATDGTHIDADIVYDLDRSYYTITAQPSGADDSNLFITNLNLFFRCDFLDSYDGHLAAYDTFKNIPFTVFYDVGFLRFYEEGYSDGYDRAIQEAELAIAKLKEEYELALSLQKDDYEWQIYNMEARHRDELADQFELGKELGKNEGYELGKTEAIGPAREEGYNEGYDAGQLVGFQNGLQAAENADFNGDFATLFYSIFDAPVQAFSNLFNFDFLGINLIGFFCAVLTLILFVWLVKVLL
jgi:hypothetical protein